MHRLRLLALAAAALGTLAATQAQDRPDLQLKAAVYRETVEGDLQGAIALYKQIVSNAATPRPIAAAALLGLGGCYEKLGDAQAREARKVYERLVAEYPDQAAEAASARQKLAGLAAASSRQVSKPAFRKITIPGEMSPGAQLSPDGARLAMVTGGDVWIVNLRGKVAPEIAGVPERLSQGTKASWTGLTWSRDGQWIAFNEDGIPTRNMYVLPVSGGAPRKVPRAVPSLGGDGWWLGLSSDGGRLAYSTRLEGRMVLQMISVNTGENVMRFGNPDALEPRFSPDNSHIAYVRLEKWWADPVGEVRVIRLADRSDSPVTDTPLLFRSLAWSPDGSLLAFLAHPDKADLGKDELWIAPVPGTGGLARAPLKIELPRFAQGIAGWTADNRIGLLLSSPSRNAIYTVPLSGGKATQVTPDGSTFQPQWSPDGESIYFRHGQGEIASVLAGGGAIRVVPRTGERVGVASPVGGNHISPDGKRIVWAGPKNGIPGVHLWTMPVTGGEPVLLPMKPDLDAFQPRWSPDGRWIAFYSERGVPGDRKLDVNIFIVSSEGGEPRQLTNHPDCFCWLLAWSPAGDSIAYACSDQIIRIIPIGGGEPRTVLKVDGLQARSNSLAWTLDGSRLLYSAKGRLWTVPTAGGAPAAISTDLDGDIMQFALSPDGKTIAFNAPSGGGMELWLMEDFLHLVRAAQPQKARK